MWHTSGVKGPYSTLTLVAVGPGSNPRVVTVLPPNRENLTPAPPSSPRCGSAWYHFNSWSVAWNLLAFLTGPCRGLPAVPSLLGPWKWPLFGFVCIPFSRCPVALSFWKFLSVRSRRFSCLLIFISSHLSSGLSFCATYYQCLWPHRPASNDLSYFLLWCLALLSRRCLNSDFQLFHWTLHFCCHVNFQVIFVLWIFISIAF